MVNLSEVHSFEPTKVDANQADLSIECLIRLQFCLQLLDLLYFKVFDHQLWPMRMLANFD